MKRKKKKKLDDYLGVQGTHEQSYSPPFPPPPFPASYGLIESSDPI